MSSFRVAGSVRAFVYLTASCGRYSVAGRNQEMDGMALSDFYSGSSAGCLWFPDGVCLFLWLPGGTEKINEMAEHSKPSFRLQLLGGFGSQIGCLPCFCGSQRHNEDG